MRQSGKLLDDTLPDAEVGEQKLAMSEAGKWLELFSAFEAGSYPSKAQDFLPSARRLLSGYLVGAETILDIGCGTCLPSSHLATEDARLFGLDLLPGASQWARKRASFVAADMITAPFKDGQFDAVVCSMALMLERDISAAIDEIGRVLVQHGRAAFCILNPLFHKKQGLTDTLRQTWTFPIDSGPIRVSFYNHSLLSYWKALRKSFSDLQMLEVLPGGNVKELGREGVVLSQFAEYVWVLAQKGCPSKEGKAGGYFEARGTSSRLGKIHDTIAAVGRLKKGRKEIRKLVASKVGKEENGARSLLVIADMVDSTSRITGSDPVEFADRFVFFAYVFSAALKDKLPELEVVRLIGDQLFLAGPVPAGAASDLCLRVLEEVSYSVDMLKEFDVPVRVSVALCDAVLTGQDMGELLEELLGGEALTLPLAKNDLWGSQVYEAFRIAEVARRGQILVNSRFAEAITPDEQGAVLANPLPFVAKGFEKPIPISQLQSLANRPIVFETALIENYRFAAIVGFTVRSTNSEGLRRNYRRRLVRSLKRHFPMPCLGFVFEGVSWSAEDEERIQKDGLWVKGGEILAGWDLLVGLLCEDYGVYEKRIYDVMLEMKDVLEHSVSSPVWNPPRGQEKGIYRLRCPASAFYEIGDDGWESVNWPAYVHVAGFGFDDYGIVEGLHQRIESGEGDGGGDDLFATLGLALRPWVLIGGLDLIVVHEWPHQNVDGDAVQGPWRQRLREDIHNVPLRAALGKHPLRFCHWVGKQRDL